MKKKLFHNSLFRHTFSWFFLATFCLATLCSCGSTDVSQRTRDRFGRPITDSSPVPLPKITENGKDINNTEIGKRIRRDYFNNALYYYPQIKIEDVVIDVYYGNYNNSIPVMIKLKSGGATGDIRGDIVADISFCYNSGQSIVVWNQGLFHGLQDAYDFGLLSQEDLSDIAEYHHMIFWHCKE